MPLRCLGACLLLPLGVSPEKRQSEPSAGARRGVVARGLVTALFSQGSGNYGSFDYFFGEGPQPGGLFRAWLRKSRCRRAFQHPPKSSDEPEIHPLQTPITLSRSPGGKCKVSAIGRATCRSRNGAREFGVVGAVGGGLVAEGTQDFSVLDQERARHLEHAFLAGPKAVAVSEGGEHAAPPDFPTQ